MKYTSAFLLSCLAWTSVSAENHKSKLSPVVLVKWDSKDSQARLSRSAHKRDFFPLSNHFVSQENKLFCGLASAAIILNALRLGQRKNLPRDKNSIKKHERAWLTPGFDPFFGKYTANNILTAQTKKRLEVLGKPIKINGKLKKDYGLQLRQLARALRSHQLHVTLRIVDNPAKSKIFKKEIIKNLAEPGDFILANYDRKILGQTGPGHISPLGAYDQQSDSFLIMDVNPNKAPWVWVKSKDLINAMNSFDTIENRGYLSVSEGKSQKKPSHN